VPAKTGDSSSLFNIEHENRQSSQGEDSPTHQRQLGDLSTFFLLSKHRAHQHSFMPSPSCPRQVLTKTPKNHIFPLKRPIKPKKYTNQTGPTSPTFLPVPPRTQKTSEPKNPRTPTRKHLAELSRGNALPRSTQGPDLHQCPIPTSLQNPPAEPGKNLPQTLTSPWGFLSLGRPSRIPPRYPEKQYASYMIALQRSSRLPSCASREIYNGFFFANKRAQQTGAASRRHG